MLDQNEENMDVLILELVLLLISVHTWNENIFHGRKKTPQLQALEKFQCVLLGELT